MKQLTDILLPYQKDWIQMDDKIAFWIKSRRIGATYIEALRAVLERLEHSYDYNLVSANARTSSEYINYVKMWAEVINAMAGSEYIDLDDSTTEVVRFPNGSKIVALSSNPTALRGRGGSVTIDEAAFADNPEELWKAAQPCAQWGGKIRVISSMSSPDHWFSETVSKIERKELNYGLLKTTVYDAVDQGLAQKVPGKWQDLLPNIKECNDLFISNLKEEVGSEAAFSQEYECIPSKESMLIDTYTYDKLILGDVPEQLNPDQKYGDLFIGVDIGRYHDQTCIWVLERGYDKEAEPHLREVYRTVAVKFVKNMTFEAQYQLISKYLSLPNVIKCNIDRSGLGLQLSEQLVSEHGSLVEGVAISSPEKQGLVERTLKYISQERVSLPPDSDIKSDIVCMRRIITAKGNTSYDGKSAIGHGDAFIALAMALRAADKTSHMQILTQT